uniref:Uncharacterized protein n=1 Tax=Avena sativa TaxID=4498 RepID=A0ACD5WS68_AVESA
MEEKMAKLSFSIAPSKPEPPNPTARPAAFSVPAAVDSGPAPRFVTTFDPSQTLAPPAAPAAAVIVPLPNSRRLSTVPTGGRPAFVPDDSDSSSSSAGYGLAVRDTEDSKRRKRAAADDAATLRRFKQDMAVLPDTQGAEEYDEVPVEGFGAALLAGYGWKEGNPIGRDKSKGDPKILERGRRSGTQGLGAGPSDKTDAATVRPAAVRRSIRDLRAACLAGSVTAAPYNSRPAAVHHYNP